MKFILIGILLNILMADANAFFGPSDAVKACRAEHPDWRQSFKRFNPQTLTDYQVCRMKADDEYYKWIGDNLAVIHEDDVVYVPQEKIKYKPVEVIREVIIEKIIEKEIKVEVEKIVERIVEVEKEVEVIREIIREVTVEVEVVNPLNTALEARVEELITERNDLLTQAGLDEDTITALTEERDTLQDQAEIDATRIAELEVTEEAFNALNLDATIDGDDIDTAWTAEAFDETTITSPDDIVIEWLRNADPTEGLVWDMGGFSIRYTMEEQDSGDWEFTITTFSGDTIGWTATEVNSYDAMLRTMSSNIGIELYLDTIATEAYNQGYADGYEDGYRAGYADGFAAGVASVNGE